MEDDDDEFDRAFAGRERVRYRVELHTSDERSVNDVFVVCTLNERGIATNDRQRQREREVAAD